MDAAPSRAPLGPLSDWTVPQQWFSHFYAVGSVWNFAVLVTFAVSVRERGMSTFEVTLYCTTLVLFEVHLVRRFLETVALLKYPKGARMHGIAYVFGLSYYIIVSLTLIPPSSYVLMAKALIGETRIDFDNFNVSDLHLAINFAINFTLLRATVSPEFW
jgi:3-oxo-5-alpha-steroid 4-dehydrogenase 3